MTTNVAWIEIDAENGVQALRQEAAARVNGGESEVILDFSAVARIDSTMVGAMEELAGLAEARSVAVVLRGVNVDIYRALKLLGLARRFSFRSE